MHACNSLASPTLAAAPPPASTPCGHLCPPAHLQALAWPNAQVRAELALGDFAWQAEDGTLYNGLVERKKVSDLVSRSSSGAHLEQLRRMQLSPHSRCFLLLEDNPEMAAGYTAFGADGQSTLVRDRDEVYDLLASLFADVSHVAKTIQCPAGNLSTQEALCRLSAVLPTLEAPRLRPTLEAFNAQTRKAAASRARSELERLLVHGNVAPSAASAVSLSFGSRQAAQGALMHCPAALRPRLLCPVLADCVGVEAQRRCSSGAWAACCEQSERCYAVLCDKGGDAGGYGSSRASDGPPRSLQATGSQPEHAPTAVICLDSSDDEDGGVSISHGAGDAGRGHGRFGPRLLRIDVSEVARHSKLFAEALPSHQRLSVRGDGSRGWWMELWAEQGSARSALFRVAEIDARELEDSMRLVCDEMASAQIEALANVAASRALACAASKVAQRVLAHVPAPRAPTTRAPARCMLVLTGLEGMRRRLGKGENGPAERRFADCAWALSQATILAILAEHPMWHVHVATTKDKAVDFHAAVLRQVDKVARLDARSSRFP